MAETKRIPYLIDPHVHDRWNQEQKEDWDTLEAACVAGGVLQKMLMPNNSPLISTGELLDRKSTAASPHLLTDTGFHLGTMGRNHTRFNYQECFPKVTGLKVYMNGTTGHYLVDDLPRLTYIFQHWPRGKPILVHAEGAMTAVALGLAGIYGQTLYICHVSEKAQVDLIEAAKEGGQKVFAEVTPHHLFLPGQENSTNYSRGTPDPYQMMIPALSNSVNREALWAGIESGVIDVIGTDHAPHTKAEKEATPPAFGVTGLETTLPLLLLAARRGQISWDKIIELTHTNPQRIFGLEEQPESYIETVYDPHEIRGDNLYTKSKHTPFEGERVCDRVYRSVLRGQVLFEDGRVVGIPGSGQIF